MDKETVNKIQEESREQILKVWDDQDLKSMALESIDYLCLCIQDGMDKDKALDLIYRFSHCSYDHGCYSSHDDWRKELKEFYKYYFLENNKH